MGIGSSICIVREHKGDTIGTFYMEQEFHYKYTQSEYVKGLKLFSLYYKKHSPTWI